MRKKIWVLFIVSFVCCLLIAPMIVGLIFERQYKNVLTIISYHDKINLKIIDYKRHWFYSEVTLATNYPLIDKPMDLDARLSQIIYHGPILWRTQRPGLAFAAIDTYIQQGPHLAATLVHFNQTIATELHLDNYAVKKINDPTAIYVITGLKGNINLSLLHKQLVAKINLSRLESTLAGKRHIENFSSYHQLAENGYGFWSGRNTYHFGTLIWHQEESDYTFDNFDIDIFTSLKTHYFQTAINGHIQSVRINNSNYGEQKASLVIDHLDPTALKALQPFLAPTQLSVSECCEFQQAFMALFKEGITITVNDLVLNMAWGQLKLKGDWHYPPLPHATTFAQIVSGANLKVVGQTSMMFARTLLTRYYALQPNCTTEEVAKEMADKTLNTWQQAGWLINAGEKYIVKYND